MRHVHLVPLVLALAFTPAAPLAAQDALRLGIDAYRAGRYARAVDHFHDAAAAPATAAEGKAWLVPALVAAGQAIDFAVVDAAQADPRYANAVRVAFGLGRWHAGDRGSALSWVGSFCERSRPGYDRCARVRDMVEADGPAPSPARWPELAGLPGAGAGAAAPAPQPVPPAPRPAPQRPHPPSPAPGQPAAPRPASATPARWLPHGAFRVGDRVRFTPNGGPIWYTGVVERVGPDPNAVAGTTEERYLIRNERLDGREWVDRNQVAAIERAPFWTGFFVGDWEISVPMAMNTRVVGRDLYRVFSGGMRLPPLRVNADGTYTWRVDENGRERLVRGRWVPREDAPGIVLLAGDRGADWTLSNVTDRGGLERFGRDQIHLKSDCCTHWAGQRIAQGGGR